MIASLTLILLAQLLGEGIARSSGLPVPGPVIGMALMLGFLVLRDRGPRLVPRLLPPPLTDGTLERTGKGLLANLSLMFVPAGAGIVGRLDVLEAQGAKLALVLVVSTAAALLATVLTFLAVQRLIVPPAPPEAPPERAR
ncbi:CidA/LrgA family protein [Methylobacterium planeticum]|uniref:CidA/LrgA family protein n=1 Tax=Methylobacterium planeticum TaxID=2615211 RepID=A0A6N6MQQ9_9HYPH|nr:CidA/LrgA family protein [Methylobacterium planeticum]KAB1072673.1 CidA/LrgA family protein [Methylobacterium planeticum]